MTLTVNQTSTSEPDDTSLAPIVAHAASEAAREMIKNESTVVRKVYYYPGFVFRELRAQELCESRGGRPGLPVPNSP